MKTEKFKIIEFIRQLIITIDKELINFPKKENELNNSASNNFTTSSDIECSAKKCNYNCFGTCTASSVQINFNNASCDTFVSF